MKKILLNVLIMVVVCTVIGTIGLTGCKSKGTTETTVAESTAVGETTVAETATEETTASNLAGTTIKYLGTTEIHDLMIQKFLADFTEETGINVEMELLGQSEAIDKMKLEAAQGSDTYDIICNQTYSYSPFIYNGWVANLDEIAAQYNVDLAIDDTSGIVQVNGQMNGQTYGWPVLLAILGNIQYRTDLFTDPKEMQAFKAKYGYELAPPKNWKEYADISEFFTRDTNDDGKVDFWGNNTILAADGSIYDMWLIRYMGNKTADDADPAYNYLFTKDLQPRFNDDAGVQAIQEIADLYIKGYTYPGSLASSWPSIVEPQSNGQAAMCYGWSEALLPSMIPENSQYADVSAWSPMPYNVQPRMETGGWVQMILVNSKNKEAAIKFIQWCGSAETEYKLLTQTDYWKVPFRAENKAKPEIMEGYEYYKIPMAMLDTYEVRRELFIPEIDMIQNALNVELQRVVVGEKTAKQALDDAAKAIGEGFTEAGAYERVKAEQ